MSQTKIQKSKTGKKGRPTKQQESKTPSNEGMTFDKKSKTENILTVRGVSNEAKVALKKIAQYQDVPQGEALTRLVLEKAHDLSDKVNKPAWKRLLGR